MQLSDSLETHFPRLQPGQKRGLKSLGIETVADLLYHFPSRYENVRDIRTVSELTGGEQAILYGRIDNLKTKKAFKSKRPIAEGTFRDETGSIKVMWFNQPYIAKMLTDGSAVKLIGKVTGGTSPYIANPETEQLAAVPVTAGAPLFAEESGVEAAFVPIYSESRGISSKWLMYAVQRIFASGVLETITDPIPADIRKKYNLPSRQTALVWIHSPQSEADSAAARKRFAFEEVFFIQLAKQKQRNTFETESALAVDVNEEAIASFIDTFPFTPTGAQKRAIESIVSDFSKPHPMHRLLEGDVGSGKTAIAAATVYAVSHTHPYGDAKNGRFGNLQTAYMVPTEILARQHFASFIEYFRDRPISIALITGNECRKFPSKVDPTQSTHISRTQLLKWVANGEIPIVIGTHALIQKNVVFQDLAYVIIDEQHRFGTVQRRDLARKDDNMPHLLSMSATPIPRTLALTIYGDLDITVLDELPAGRKPIKTKVVIPEKRNDTYEKIRKELEAGRQAYVICPRIDAPDPEKENAVQAKSVTEETKRLQRDVFPEYTVAGLHGKMSAKLKEEIMQKFENGDIDILVATSVVEVGVNVPNATMIVIEGAERFGLAQLHQLRGRVQRSSHQPYCYVFTDSAAKTTTDRLHALEQAKDGFELAEYDLKLRGAGELYGRRQWGVSDVGMEAMQNPKMVEAARNAAIAIIEQDAELTAYPELKTAIATQLAALHFE